MSETARQPRLLLIDDDETFRKVLSRELTRRGYPVDTASGGDSAVQKLREGRFDVALLDMNMPDMDGMEVLRQVRKESFPVEIVVLTGHGTIDAAIQAIRLGAYDYVTKPCPVDQLEVRIQKAWERHALAERNAILSDGLAPSPAGVEDRFVGRSTEFRKMTTLIGKVAPTDTSVLIEGETGVGKGMVAGLIHAQSHRNSSPFVTVDCGAFHENLLQSELFGHEKGAFTGAVRLRHGLFEVADKGTVFLDEIGNVSLETQAKLLRIVETGLFRRLGSSKEDRVSVRVIAATNKDLRILSKKGLFREDLFFRLGTIHIKIAPLRERPDDIEILIHHFLTRLNERYGQSRRLSPEAIGALQAYSWPGNARELSNVVEQAFVLSDHAEVQRADLPPALSGIPISGRTDSPQIGNLLPLREVQQRHVEAVLKQVEGNRARAARILQISVRNLYRVVKKLGLESKIAPPTSDQDF